MVSADFLTPTAFLKGLQDRGGIFSVPMIIQETTGGSRQITLRGRSLPFREVAFPSELRVNTKYFPGNPIGQAQVLGATWEDTTMGGRWADHLLVQDDSSAKLHNFPPLTFGVSLGSNLGGETFESVGVIPEDDAKKARVLVDAVSSMQRSGALLKVTWGQIARFGFIRTFTPTFVRADEVLWEISFTWIGDTDAPPSYIESPQDTLGLLAIAIKLLQEGLNKINQALSLVIGGALKLTQLIRKVGTVITDLINLTTSFVKLIFIPAELLGTVMQQIASARLAIQDLVRVAGSVPAGYLAKKSGANQEEVNEAEEAILAILYNAQVLGLDIQEIADKLARSIGGSLLGIAILQTGQTLRDISREYYGTPEHWGEIAEYNGFSKSYITAGAVIRVPRR